MKRQVFWSMFCVLLAPFACCFGLTFHKSADTLNAIMEVISKKETGAYLRFGDGDLLLAHGNDDSWQRKNGRLQLEMREAFALNGPNILKGLPIGCAEFGGYEEGMSPGNHLVDYEFSQRILRLAAPLWNYPIEDVYSPTALHLCSTHNHEMCIKFLKFLKQSNYCILVGNCKIPPEIRKLLFGEQCHFVPTPERNSYDDIDRIEAECLDKVQKIEGYKVIVTSMGCAGRVLQKRLLNQVDDVFLFDFGSLMDALCGWETRAWIEITRSNFENDKFLQLLHRELCEPAN